MCFKRKGVVLHHNNAHPNTPQLTKSLLKELSWKKLLHPPYSSDPSSSDYHLFRGLQKHLDGLRLTSREEIEHELVSLKLKEFYKHGKFVRRWNEVLGNNTGYVNDLIFLLAFFFLVWYNMAGLFQSDNLKKYCHAQIYIYINISWPTVVKGNPKSSFSIAITSKWRWRCYAFPGLLHLPLIHTI